MKKNWPYLLLIAVLIGIDQVSKAWLSASLPHGSTRPVISGFFNLSHVHNRGAIFGFFNRSGGTLIYPLLTVLSLIALGLVVYYFIKVPASQKLLKLTLSLVLAGALGNQIDRIFRGYVIDFLDFYIGRHHFPSFNAADSCITIGAGLLIFIFFFRKGSQCFLSSSG